MSLPPSSPLRAYPTSSSPPRGTQRSSDASSPLRFPGVSSSPRSRPPIPSSLERSSIPGSSSQRIPETPRRLRGAIGSNSQVYRAMYSQSEDGMQRGPSSQVDLSSDPTATVRVIWGTSVCIPEAMKQCREFILGYSASHTLLAEQQRNPDVPIDITDADRDPYYPTLLHQLRLTETYNLNLNCQNLLDFMPPEESSVNARKLYHQLVHYPQEIIPLMDHVVSEIFVELCHEAGDTDIITEDFAGIKVRPYNLEKTVNMRELNPSDIDKLVSIKGLVIRASNIIPDLKQGFFRCSTCDHTVTVTIDRGKIEEPTVCPRPRCQSKNTMVLIHNMCEYADKQISVMQETPDMIPDGQTPHSVTLSMYDELVDVCKPGDRVIMTGIYRATPVRVNPRTRTVKSLYRTYIDVVHVKQSDKKRVGLDERLLAEQRAGGYNEDERMQAEKEEELEQFRAIANQADIYSKLVNSVAPGIFGLEDLKKGLLLQLFGGTVKQFAHTQGPKFRPDINILLIGDPGTSKSQLLQYVHRIAPRGIYTSGKGSSAVGLTAYITKDPDTNQFVLESGAMVLSDGGVCCIDELDKMNEGARSVLHEVMEQQTVSIAKAGIITTLNARTSILAAANPKDSKFNDSIPVLQNINLPPALASRFDLIFLVLDKFSESQDRDLAKHIVGLYFEDRPSHSSSVMPIEQLTKFISYARAHIHPELQDDAADLIVKEYVGLRKLGKSGKTISSTPRQLEGIIRLAEAHAKMRYSNTVTVEDVRESTRLVKMAIQTAATDPRTGLLDMDLVMSGISTGDRKRQHDLKSEIMNLIKHIRGASGNSRRGVSGVRRSVVLQELAKQSTLILDKREIQRLLEEMVMEGTLNMGYRELDPYITVNNDVLPGE